MDSLVLATHNRNKLREMRQLLDLPHVRVLCLDDLPGMPEIEETGTTFAENAILKARGVMEWSGLPTIADDSGLEVDALDGRPGVWSSRYGSPNISGLEKLLYEMEDIPLGERIARYRCVIAFVDVPDNGADLCEGSCEGLILYEPRGCNGFGYDPVFWSEELDCTFAEADPDDKNRISHRGKAMRQMAKGLLARFGK
jgi:XTP/dITP diphosphohydrolase